MSRKLYTDEFLISELQRFVSENGRSPVTIDMKASDGYPPKNIIIKHFGSWNNALIKSGLEMNKRQEHLTGYEICDNCGTAKLTNNGWRYKNNQRLCHLCYRNSKSDYMNKSLDPDSNTGKGFIGERVVAKTLGLELKYDCNCIQGFGAPKDLYDKNKYKYINIKIATLQKDSAWHFGLSNKNIPDTYIMLGVSVDKSDIVHVWITEPEDDLTFDEKNFKYKQSISVTNSERGLKRAKNWEVDAKPYNDAYHSMSLDNCSVLRSD